MADISIGVIGAGGMGSRHVMNLHRYVKGARVVAIYDLDQARARQVAAECGSAKAFSDPLQLINAWDGYMSLLVTDACIQSLQSGMPEPVSTSERPPFYQERELQ